MSLESGILIIVFISGALSLVWIKIPNLVFQWIVRLLSPLFCSYFLYWIPVWCFYGNSSEYSAWEIFFVGIWYIFGLLASMLTVVIRNKLQMPTNQE